MARSATELAFIATIVAPNPVAISRNLSELCEPPEPFTNLVPTRERLGHHFRPINTHLFRLFPFRSIRGDLFGQTPGKHPDRFPAVVSQSRTASRMDGVFAICWNARMAIRSLSRKKFDTNKPSRSPILEQTIEEVEWFADDGGNVIGVLARDRTDKDWSIAVLGRDERGKFRAPPGVRSTRRCSCSSRAARRLTSATGVVVLRLH